MSEQIKNDQELRREEELMLLEAENIIPYPYSFDKTHSTLDILNKFSDDNADEFKNVSVAGRIVAIRRMGKASFCHILDEVGRIQIYLKKDDLGEVYDRFRLFDIGDIIGVTGYVFRTKTGEITVHSQSLTLLCKSLKPLPVPKVEIDDAGNKIVHDAFTDVELRYRKRYLDLIVNPDTREIFKKRSKLITSMRKFFDSRGWLEVETPILQPIYGGANARPFITHHNALDIDLYLRIADELYLKRLIVGGFEGVYEISKNFRNEGMDKMHNPEFTSMEIYVAYKDYIWMMEMTEDLLETLCFEINQTTEIVYNDQNISFKKPFRRAKYYDLCLEYVGRDLKGLSQNELLQIARSLNLELDAKSSAMKILDEIFSEIVQPHLIQPTFVIDYPLEMSPLAKKHRTEPGLVERFELFVCGFELANAFSELNDPRDQRKRLEEQALQRAAGDEEAMVLDEDFLYALEVGMPPTAGLGIGIDRLTMIMTGAKTIRDVLFFPQMRPEPKSK